MVIPKHFVPPMLANAMLGTVLWTTYTGCSSYLQSYLGIHSMFAVALSGAAAGGMQALVAAPVENVRLVIEGGAGKGWSHAWKEVFRGTQPIIASRSQQVRDIRQLRLWMQDVTEMAGRGWAGWGWGCGKDVCGKQISYHWSSYFICSFIRLCCFLQRFRGHPQSSTRSEIRNTTYSWKTAVRKRDILQH